MPLIPSLSVRLAYALDHYRSGDWPLAKFNVIEAAKEAMLRAALANGESAKEAGLPAPEVVATELRQLSVGLAAMAEALAPACAPTMPKRGRPRGK